MTWTPAELPQPSGRRRPLAARLGRIFAVPAVLAILVCAGVVVNLLRVRQDTLEFMEESREARLAHDLLFTLDQIGDTATLPEAPASASALEGLLDRAEGILTSLSSSPEDRGAPVGNTHESTEDRLVSDVRALLAGQGGRIRKGVPPAPRPAALERRLRESALLLRAETQQESERAAGDLLRRVRRLHVLTLLIGTGAIATLLVLLLLVHRDIVRPVREVSEGARILGGGRLEHRIRARTNDEIGDLAREFNGMAESLLRSQRDLEERVESRTRQFLRAARLADLGTFAAGIAHEVNTPLASIASCAEALERRVATGASSAAEQREYLQTIAREAYRAHDITARLLAFARKDPGPAEALPLGEIVQEVARLLGHQMEARGVRLIADSPPDLPPALANRSDLVQVVLNLLKNALDASPRGGTIRVRCSPRPEGVGLEVADEGPGIPAEDLRRIFDPFFTTKEPGEGTGLGLSLVHRIVEDCGGRVEARNGPLGGAVFEVILRRPAAHAEDA